MPEMAEAPVGSAVDRSADAAQDLVRPAPWIDRASAALFRRTAIDASAEVQEAKLFGLALILQLHLTVSIGLWAWTELSDARRFLFVPLAVATVLLATRLHVRGALGLTALAVALEVTATSPAAILLLLANHNVVEYACLAILLLADHERPSDRELALGALRWLFVIVLFFSGMQKLWHGSYFRGELFAWVLSVNRWPAIAALLPADELERLLQYAKVPVRFDRGVMLESPGPYRLTSPLVIALANGVWIGELASAVGLMVERLRRWALPACALLLLGIEVIVHELFFGAMMAALLLLFARRSYFLKLLPAFVLLYAFVAAAHLGFIGVEVPR